MNKLSDIHVPDHYNYVGVFLTLSCNISCSYCINHLVGLQKGRKLLNAQEWSQGLSRLKMTNKVPLTLQGGEPTIHKHFYDIVNSLPAEYDIDLLTNIQFSPEKFAQQIDKNRINREAPYAPIRVSYHPETMDLRDTLNKVIELKAYGFNVGVYGVRHPSQIKEVEEAKELFSSHGIDFRFKDFLGIHNNQLYGEYKYHGAVFSQEKRSCLCKTSELLIDPFGKVFRCHHDLYNNKNPVGDILDPNYQIEDIFRPCDYFGSCNPCDVKVKNNRFQQFGHTSVEIRL